MTQPIDNILAFTWWRRRDYAILCEVSQDTEGLCADYEDWLAGAEAAFAKYEKLGFNPHRVYLDVQEYVDWCQLRSKDVDMHSRELFKELKRQEFYRGLDE